jgi:hypothetical protein
MISPSETISNWQEAAVRRVRDMVGEGSAE